MQLADIVAAVKAAQTNTSSKDVELQLHAPSTDTDFSEGLFAIASAIDRSAEVTAKGLRLQSEALSLQRESLALQQDHLRTSTDLLAQLKELARGDKLQEGHLHRLALALEKVPESLA